MAKLSNSWNNLLLDDPRTRSVNYLFAYLSIHAFIQSLIRFYLKVTFCIAIEDEISVSHKCEIRPVKKNEICLDRWGGYVCRLTSN